jgi:hypothetical protein
MNIYETGKKETVVRRNNGNTSIAGRNINRNIRSNKFAAAPAIDTGQIQKHRNSSFCINIYPWNDTMKPLDCQWENSWFC